MKKSLLFILILMGNLSVFSQQEESFDQQNVVLLASSDKEMNNAILDARRTFAFFKSAFENKTSTQEGFAIKYPFEVDESFEHIWLSNIKIKKGKIAGKVGNVPQYTSEVKFGDKVEIDPKMISDWMYFDKGKLVGGTTIMVLRNRMPEDERKQFDKVMGIQ